MLGPPHNRLISGGAHQGLPLAAVRARLRAVEDVRGGVRRFVAGHFEQRRLGSVEKPGVEANVPRAERAAAERSGHASGEDDRRAPSEIRNRPGRPPRGDPRTKIGDGPSRGTPHADPAGSGNSFARKSGSGSPRQPSTLRSELRRLAGSFSSAPTSIRCISGEIPEPIS